MEVACPHCHATQLEARISLSTFCRSCGGHFKIDKSRGVVSQGRKDLEKITREVGRELAQSSSPGSGVSAENQGAAPAAKEALPLHPAPGAPNYRLTRTVRPNGAGAFANRHRPRPVACFQCETTVEVSYAAKLATCPECGEEINLNDYEISKPLSEDVLTRGSVIINRSGALECENVVCHNLRAYGQIRASVHATGDVMFRTRAILPGGLRCEKLIVGRGASVHVQGDVHAGQMEIGGAITAEAFHCGGTTRIDEHGAINGPLTTRSVDMEDGGGLNGALQILSRSH